MTGVHQNPVWQGLSGKVTFQEKDVVGLFGTGHGVTFKKWKRWDLKEKEEMGPQRKVRGGAFRKDPVGLSRKVATTQSRTCKMKDARRKILG